jgi:hypothetical protein
MARAYSLDLRERVVAAILRGLSCRGSSARFDVGVASVVKGSSGHVRPAAQPPDRWAASGPIFWRASAAGCWLVSTRSPI